MTRPSKSDYSVPEVAGWLFTAIEGHLPVKEMQSTLVTRFGFAGDEACIALQCARDGMLRAISGSRKNIPKKLSNPIGHATFELVWSTFNQNSFFDKRRTPTRKWLD